MKIQNLPVEHLLQKRKALRRELLENAHSPIKIAVLGGVTTHEVVDLLELLLLADGFLPAFYQSDYNRYYEEAVLEPEQLRAFQPDIVYVHTHWKNLHHLPPVDATEGEFQERTSDELERYQTIWNSIQEFAGCQIIRNNFENPPVRILGSQDSVSHGGTTRFIHELNREFARAARGSRSLLVHDLNALAAAMGHAQWFDWGRWYSYKMLTTPEANLAIAKSLAAMIGAIFGKTKKCLILDLDNTLWGGVIGEDGVNGIEIGKETAVAEAYTAFQEYCLALRRRGVLLAVCSKNDPDAAKSGFSHPASILALEDFAAFKANWESKDRNIREIAEELNLGLDSFVFVDDNPAERAIVSAQLPEVTVPDVGSEVALYPAILEAGHFFEVVSLSKEDLQRTESYAANATRSTLKAKFASYDEYLDSLRMTADISPFQPIYLERITQLINKSNQFNLTTLRYTFTEIERIASDPNYTTCTARLSDVFGDNGLISVVIGHREGADLHIDLWLMSCRVLKRDVELAMLDYLVECAGNDRIERIVGYFSRTAKNAMVEDHYGKLGFTLQHRADDGSSSFWTLPVAGYLQRNKHILIESRAEVVK
jgi:FkbH-like protein